MLQFVPLLYAGSLRLPWPLVLAAAITVTAEAGWLLRRVRARSTLRDPVLVGVDVACGLGLTAAGAAAEAAAGAAGPAGLGPVLPYLFVAVALAGLGLGPAWSGGLAFGALAAAWAALALPSGGLLVESGLVGLGLCYALTLYIARYPADEGRPRDRELAFAEIHGRLLPIVDAVASGAALSGPWTALAVREAARARRLMVGDPDGPLAAGPGLGALLSDVRDTFAEAGLAVTSVFRIAADPPARVAEAVADAAREALTNVLKHAGPRCEVHLFAESAAERLEVVVRDRGLGFEPDAVTPGCGFDRTYRAVRRLGGAVDVRSSPGTGTKVRIRWPAADTGPTS